MARLLVMAGAAFLAGCAGVGEMREEGPFATFTSTKPPDVIAACISEAWTMQKVGSLMTPDVRINPITGGKQVMIYNAHGMSPDAIADITSGVSGSRIAYYAKHREAFKKQFGGSIGPCL